MFSYYFSLLKPLKTENLSGKKNACSGNPLKSGESEQANATEMGNSFTLENETILKV